MAEREVFQNLENVGSKFSNFVVVTHIKSIHTNWLILFFRFSSNRIRNDVKNDSGGI